MKLKQFLKFIEWNKDLKSSNCQFPFENALKRIQLQIAFALLLQNHGNCFEKIALKALATQPQNVENKLYFRENGMLWQVQVVS